MIAGAVDRRLVRKVGWWCMGWKQPGQIRNRGGMTWMECQLRVVKYSITTAIIKLVMNFNFRSR